MSTNVLNWVSASQATIRYPSKQTCVCLYRKTMRRWQNIANIVLGQLRTTIFCISWLIFPLRKFDKKASNEYSFSAQVKIEQHSNAESIQMFQYVFIFDVLLSAAREYRWRSMVMFKQMRWHNFHVFFRLSLFVCAVFLWIRATIDLWKPLIVLKLCSETDWDTHLCWFVSK